MNPLPNTTVFADLGFSPKEAEHLRIRSELMIAVERMLDRLNVSQREAAERLGVRQPRISDLRRGKLERFSIDALVEMLDRLGAQVTVSVRLPKRAA